VIALLMRRALHDGVERCALVTPDRALARRVAASLARWDIAVDDSAGRPLRQSAPGALLCLVAEMVAAEAAPVPLLAVLNHPLVQAGRDRDLFGRAVRRLERDRLRGVRPAPGFDALRHDDPDVALLVDELARESTPLADLMRGSSPLPALVAAHVALAEWLTRDETGRVALWDGEAGEAAAEFVAGLRQAAVALPPQPGRDYAGLFATLLQDQVLRPRAGAGGRLAIWGPLEARLQQADLLILGGLNEDTWPRTGQPDPWLSRPMRARLGLPTPERRIGQQAHDFAQLAAAPRVVLTRADKVDGAPTVPSRWLLRMDQLLARSGLAWERQLPADLLGWHRDLSRPDAVKPVAPPQPRPPVAARPRRLSVTRIETWMRNPYAIFARHILRLERLDPLDQDPGAAERGTAVHAALQKFVDANRAALPPDALEQLLALGTAEFGSLLERPGFRAFWWPWYRRAMRRFLADEQARRAQWTPLAGESRGVLQLDGFELTAVADRIDGASGALDVVDYKTGAMPTNKDIAAGLSPQLPLEVAIARAGGFAGIAAMAGVTASHWLIGPRSDGLKPVKDAAHLADEAVDGVRALIAAFADPATPYLACPRPAAAPAYNDYDLLARQPEWSAAGEAP
jgi:ATP-dependent helicase/nuclease subunit B